MGYFNPKYKIGCDADWFARVQDAGFHLDVIPEILLHKRIHANNLSSNVKQHRLELIDVLVTSIRRKRSSPADYKSVSEGHL
jgi:hypothetical protein